MRSILAAFVVLVSAACASGGRGAARGATPDATLDVDGVRRGYRLHVPASWDRTQPVPLLLVFHGAGSDAADIAYGSGFDAFADAAPMLVAYPEALGGRFDVDPPAGRASGDVRFVDLLVEQLRARFPVDARRIYASGFSNGAAFCTARRRSSRLLAAIGPVAGYLAPGLPAATVPVPQLQVHGTADDRVRTPPYTGDATQPVPDWARRSGATRFLAVTTPADMGGLPVTRIAYAGSTPRSDAVLLSVQGEGHVWPGSPGGPITRALLEFFRAHPSDAPIPAGAPSK
jgi:polyhydroxybutyrate depolymerase